VGTEIHKDEPYAEVESVKAVSDVIAPLSGEITEVNDGLSGDPEKINEDPYGDGWLVRIKLSDPGEVEQLLDASAYEATLDG
jgi:glycine cleavage system H protein